MAKKRKNRFVGTPEDFIIENHESVSEAEFANPFSGMVPDRLMNKEELIRALRLDIAAEEEAAHLYDAQADATDDPQVAEVLRDIAKEEIVHVGEFQKLLAQLDPEEAELLLKGTMEVDQINNTPEFPMERKMNMLSEAKDLNVYKRLLLVLKSYADRFPGTGVSRMFDDAAEQGKKILPKDKLAIDILHYILKTSSVPEAIHKMLNWRFSDLPIEYRPLIKNGRRKEVAHWYRDALVSSKIKDLIDWKNTGKAGYWASVEGEKIKLHDLKKEEK